MGLELDNDYASRQTAAEAARQAALEQARREAAAEARRQQQIQQQQSDNLASLQGDVNLRELSFRNRLQQQQPTQSASPYQALEQIKQLPKPDPNDRTAVEQYKTQRREIAQNAINNSQPPTLDDFSGLNGATRNFEYQDALQSYNSQISQLEQIVEEAETYPDRILSPGEAVTEINNLPRPDRNDPQSVLEYNNRRAEIADSALMYAEPPKIEDFRNSGLNGATANMEYQDALDAYNSNISQLEEYSTAGGTSVLPEMTDAEIEAAANSYIQNHNGVDDEEDGYAVGRDIATLAETDPEGAAAVMERVQQKLESTTYGDNVASGFVENTSVEEMREISRTPEGRQMLEGLQEHLLMGDVHDNEYDQANKINEAITGFNRDSLTGNPEQDAQTVDAQLKNLPPEMRDDYVQALLEDPFGQQAIKYAGAMTPEGAEMLGVSLGEVYENDPGGTTEFLNQITNAPDASLYPYYYQSGLAYAISKSGNDDLIQTFAQNQIELAKNDPDEVRGYLNAATAYSGLSPEALQEVMETNPDFYTMVAEATRLSGGPVESANIFEPGVGDLLEVASQIQGPNGEATPEAIQLFETVVENPGPNFRTLEGLGAFFVEHAQQLVDKYTNPLDPNTPNSDVLENFFGNVVYSPISETLKYEDGSLVEAIMGNDRGEGGVIGDVVQTYLDQANATGNDREDDTLLGQRIGFLWSGISKGFFHSVENYKDQWNEDKEFRDFTFDMLGKGLGKIADKFGLPGEVVETPLGFVQGIMDAKAEDEKEKQLDLFVEAFNDINNAMFTRLNNYDVNNRNVEGMNTGFTTAYNWEQVQELLNDVIRGG